MDQSLTCKQARIKLPPKTNKLTALGASRGIFLLPSMKFH